MTHLAFTPEMVVLALLGALAAFVTVCWGIAIILHGPAPRGVKERDVRAWAREELAVMLESSAIPAMIRNVLREAPEQYRGERGPAGPAYTELVTMMSVALNDDPMRGALMAWLEAWYGLTSIQPRVPRGTSSPTLADAFAYGAESLGLSPECGHVTGVNIHVPRGTSPRACLACGMPQPEGAVSCPNPECGHVHGF